jgi:DNA helicase II / ATP-dependent DNA helicase PcrA
MPVSQNQYDQANLIQDAAAQDLNSAVRLVAGPGTGKSFVIEGRVAWLIQQQNIPPSGIIAVSFTRAAANDLKDRIYSKAQAEGINDIHQLRVSTLHSLALFILRRTGNLAQYPVDPVILDNWELSNVFDAEFSRTIGVTPTRSSEIRRDHEAFWSTGTWNPANLPALNIPITPQERASFQGHYSTRTQAYSCVLPGEVIRTCVDSINAGHIDPVAELNVQHIIIDEVQDLNLCDFEFIDALIQRGVNVFICGDDDQSVYSFRYAFPQGIQNFTTTYPAATNHILNDCFRCSVDILAAASNVLNTFPDPNRIPKQLTSVYANSNPVNNGVMIGKRFQNGTLEVDYIANSCEELINSGVPPKDIMILVGNKRALLRDITTELQNRNIPFDANLRDDFKDTDHGRLLLSSLRILSDSDDYVAHRVMIAVPTGIGLGTVQSVTNKVIASNLNYRSIYYNSLPNNVFTKREVTAITKASTNINTINGWSIDDTLNLRAGDIDQLILNNFTQIEVDDWRNYINTLPIDMTLKELKEYLETDSEVTKGNILNAVYIRMQQANPAPANPLDKIRIMSFHSSKGLSAKIVFIPGLEEGIFPTTRAQQAPGLILENARLFYVAITRAKAACVLSYSVRRRINGQTTAMTASRFAQATSVAFSVPATQRLTDAEIGDIQAAINDL